MYILFSVLDLSDLFYGYHDCSIQRSCYVIFHKCQVGCTCFQHRRLDFFFSGPVEQLAIRKSHRVRVNYCRSYFFPNESFLVLTSAFGVFAILLRYHGFLPTRPILTLWTLKKAVFSHFLLSHSEYKKPRSSVSLLSMTYRLSQSRKSSPLSISLLRYQRYVSTST